MSRFNKKGFSLVEVIVALGIFTLLAVGATWILISSLRSNAIVWEQLATQTDGRRVMREVVDTVRRAEQSSIGSYPIVTTTDYELILYANIDSDTFRERVRFYLDDTNNLLVRGIIEPSGNPLSYDLLTEATTTIATHVVNGDKGNPVFRYFDESYTGSEAPLSQPIDITEVHVVNVQLELEKDPTATPVPLHVESTVHIRNLKTN